MIIFIIFRASLVTVIFPFCFPPHIFLKVVLIIQVHLFPLCLLDSNLGAAEVWTSRQALQDLYQKMLVTDLEYALDKKVEQDL